MLVAVWGWLDALSLSLTAEREWEEDSVHNAFKIWKIGWKKSIRKLALFSVADFTFLSNASKFISNACPEHDITIAFV
jgi:hypothetical protein